MFFNAASLFIIISPVEGLNDPGKSASINASLSIASVSWPCDSGNDNLSKFLFCLAMFSALIPSASNSFIVTPSTFFTISLTFWVVEL